ncbi:glycoside hydrolase family 16 protein [Collybiopsis luxurians FD-317 M1]|uniref:Glycoside hydrolase family 16 protein n=1 Tax=Collybiopsis luxurians FD-317 M1 TaxID=944289 RepID=A0A0D0CJQ9_9AGAR|nr:glycoside hydrolase family 16 protein [Collybiopsis luxurians FD-317 M1]
MAEQRYQAVNRYSPTASRTDLVPLQRRPGTASNRGSFLDSSPYDPTFASRASSSIAAKFSLNPDPKRWNSIVDPRTKEPDDDLHNPDPRRDRLYDNRFAVSGRGIANIGCILLLISVLLGLFAGYPVASYFTTKSLSTNGGYNLGGVNASGQVPDIGNFGLIDQDTPEDAYYLTSYTDGSTEYQLVFSDEFNTDGRSFWSSDDPYWEAVDLHYWQTNDLEWYSPEAITTKDGYLQITLSEKDAASNHNLDYQGGMMSTWNKFCFTGGLVLASVRLPGSHKVSGLWPALWTLGNLGRAGYGASLEGMWPYSYDTCDVGTVANQSVNGVPNAAVDGTGDTNNDGALSYLKGQRLSRCTCSGESHPGPVHSDGTYVGRAAPEIDIFEAQVSNGVGQVSQSAQWAPFDYQYIWENTTDNYIVYNSTGTSENSYAGGAYQESTSFVSNTQPGCYELDGDCFSTFGIEYSPGYESDGGFVTWIQNDTAAWTLKAAGVQADSTVNISARFISREPMYLVTNLAISENFAWIDYDNLEFPAVMSIDWIRVYQKKGEINIGCDPSDFPTAAYIEQYSGAYTNPNYTSWDDYGQSWPKNSYLDEC